MALNRADVDRVAFLSRLSLDEDARDRLTEELGRVLDYVDKLNELDTSGVEPMSHPGNLRNVFREDEVTVCPDREKTLANAPDRAGGYFRVPKVIE